MRDALVAALVDCAGSRPTRARTRRFLTGLSSDELQFIAGCLGSRILGSNVRFDPAVRGFSHPESPIAASRCHDREHKMILLREFLGRSGMGPAPQPVRTAPWN